MKRLEKLKLDILIYCSYYLSFMEMLSSKLLINGLQFFLKKNFKLKFEIFKFNKSICLKELDT